MKIVWRLGLTFVQIFIMLNSFLCCLSGRFLICYFPCLQVIDTFVETTNSKPHEKNLCFYPQTKRQQRSFVTSSTRKISPGCEKYISIPNPWKLVSAQPIEWTGKIISRWRCVEWIQFWSEWQSSVDITTSVRRALKKGKIAKQNPEFKLTRIPASRVRSIKMKGRNNWIRVSSDF